VFSYNKVNGTWACENGGIINKLMKDELGFRGYMMSDWNGEINSILPSQSLCLTWNSSAHNCW
jgi:beta-glucosidase-like glycosyl hydrolase